MARAMAMDTEWEEMSWLVSGYTKRTAADMKKIVELLNNATGNSLQDTSRFIDSNFQHVFSGMQHTIGVSCKRGQCLIYDNLQTEDQVIIVKEGDGLLPFYERICKIGQVYFFHIHA